MIVRRHYTKNFTTMNNEAIQNKGLSFKATGILAYLMSLPPNWNISGKQVSKVKKDGRDAVYSGLKELSDAGYIRRRHENIFDGTNISEDGKDMGHVVTYCDVTEIPFDFGDKTEAGIGESRNMEKPDSGNAVPIKDFNYLENTKSIKPSNNSFEDESVLAKRSKKKEKNVKLVSEATPEQLKFCNQFRTAEIEIFGDQDRFKPGTWERETLPSWLEGLRLLEKCNNMPVASVRELHRAVLDDPFWHEQIRSPVTYRKKDKQGLVVYQKLRNKLLGVQA